jgi:hypothetical protein
MTNAPRMFQAAGTAPPSETLNRAMVTRRGVGYACANDGRSARSSQALQRRASFAHGASHLVRSGRVFCAMRA